MSALPQVAGSPQLLQCAGLTITIAGRTLVRDLNLTPEQTLLDHPWLRPQPLTAGEVSLVLKHRLAWDKIATGESDYAIVAEDDVILFDHSLAYLARIISMLHEDFDYIDVAGGVGLFPSRADPLVNSCFYRIEPPRPFSRKALVAWLRQRGAADVVLKTRGFAVHPEEVRGWLRPGLQEGHRGVSPVVFLTRISGRPVMIVGERVGAGTEGTGERRDAAGGGNRP